MKEKKVTVKMYTADEGKVFQRIEDSVILGNTLTLGVKDSISNYAEVDEPNEEGDQDG